MVDPWIVSLYVEESEGIERTSWPVTIGVPLPHNEIRDIACLELQKDRIPVPFQAEPILLWPNHSVKWVLLDFLVNIQPRKKERYNLCLLSRPSSDKREHLPQTRQKRGGLLWSGEVFPWDFHVDSVRGEIRLFVEEHLLHCIPVASHGGIAHAFAGKVPAVDSEGSMRVSICLPGRWMMGGVKGPFCLLRMEAFHASRWIKLEQILLNDVKGDIPCEINSTGFRLIWKDGYSPQKLDPKEGWCCIKAGEAFYWLGSMEQSGLDVFSWDFSQQGMECTWNWKGDVLQPGMARRSVLWLSLPTNGEPDDLPGLWYRALHAPLVCRTQDSHYERCKVFPIGWSPDQSKSDRWENILHMVKDSLLQSDIEKKRDDPCLTMALFQASTYMGDSFLFSKAMAAAEWDANRVTVHHGPKEGWSRDSDNVPREEPVFSRSEGLFQGYCLTGDLWFIEAAEVLARKLLQDIQIWDHALPGEDVPVRVGRILSQLSMAYACTYDKTYLDSMRSMILALLQRQDICSGGTRSMGDLAYGLLCYHWISGDQDCVDLIRRVVEKALSGEMTQPSDLATLLAPILFLYHVTQEVSMKNIADRIWESLCSQLESGSFPVNENLGATLRSMPMALRLMLP